MMFDRRANADAPPCFACGSLVLSSLHEAGASLAAKILPRRPNCVILSATRQPRPGRSRRRSSARTRFGPAAAPGEGAGTNGGPDGACTNGGPTSTTPLMSSLSVRILVWKPFGSDPRHWNTFLPELGAETLHASAALLPHLKLGFIEQPQVTGIPAVSSVSPPGGMPPNTGSASPSQWISSTGFGGSWISGPVGLSPVTEPVLLRIVNWHTSFQANA